MKRVVGTLMIKNYHTEDFINILLREKYIVELEQYDNETTYVVIYEREEDE